MRCDYCDERKGIKTVYNQIYGSRDRVVYETNHFLVFPCLGQLREGHLLIVLKNHVNAIGMLESEEMKELEKLIDRLSNYFKQVYGMDMLCFEHGVLDDKGHNGGCGIYHMHLHLLPANQDEFIRIRDRIQEDSANEVVSIKELSETCVRVAEDKTYILLMRVWGEQKKEAYVITNTHNYFASQYMRKITGEVFGRTDWDWHEKKQEEAEFLKTLEKSRHFLNRNNRGGYMI